MNSKSSDKVVATVYLDDESFVSIALPAEKIQERIQYIMSGILTSSSLLFDDVALDGTRHIVAAKHIVKVSLGAVDG